MWEIGAKGLSQSDVMWKCLNWSLVASKMEKVAMCQEMQAVSRSWARQGYGLSSRERRKMEKEEETGIQKESSPADSLILTWWYVCQSSDLQTVR